MKSFTLLVFGVLLLLGGGCRYSTVTSDSKRQEGIQPLHEVRYVMGTLLDVTMYLPPGMDGRALLNEAFAIAERLDQKLSTYKPDSDVSMFNVHLEVGARATSPVLVELVERSAQLSEVTEGAFDITVRPLVDLWHGAAARGVVPSDRELKEIGRLVDYRALIATEPSKLTRRVRGVQIETGGIGKGFAVDKMVSLLSSRGVTSAFINFGRSTMAAIGAPPGASGWHIELELEEGVGEGTLSLKDETLSVSRARGNPFVVGGVSYAHIFDPRTKGPVRTVRGAAVRTQKATDGEAYVKFLVIRGVPSAYVEKKWQGAQWIVKTQGDATRHSLAFWEPRSPKSSD